ncbi:MAG: hypothetical protein ACI9O0_001333 [Paracoccaceae bacterium]|jgi:hypothetical protein
MAFRYQTALKAQMTQKAPLGKTVSITKALISGLNFFKVGEKLLAKTRSSLLVSSSTLSFSKSAERHAKLISCAGAKLLSVTQIGINSFQNLDEGLAHRELIFKMNTAFNLR